MGHQPALQSFDEVIGPNDPAREALAKRFGELRELQERGDPALQPGSKFFTSRHGQFVQEVLGGIDFLDPTGVGGASLTFSQTEAGVRLAASLGVSAESDAAALRRGLDDTLHELALDLLPPEDVDDAMAQLRSGKVVKSKLAFQAVLQNLADEARNAGRRADLRLQEENERLVLTQARSRIIVDTIGRDVGAAVLFALGSVGGNE